jgi:cytidylate kinase
MVIDGKPPGEEIRSPEVNAQVSAFAALPPVRAFLLEYQRGQAATAREAGFAGLIMEGRDIGSVIFPRADFRFFLQADPEARIARRAAQGQADSIRKRDQLDSQRKASPLVCPEGARLIDSTHLTLDEVVERMAGLIEAGR